MKKNLLFTVFTMLCAGAVMAHCYDYHGYRRHYSPPPPPPPHMHGIGGYHGYTTMYPGMSVGVNIGSRHINGYNFGRRYYPNNRRFNTFVYLSI